MKDIVGIYKITNSINDKIYIGQSVRCYTRWKAHISEAVHHTNDYKITKAMIELGIENFKMEIIEKLESSQLDEREKYWILYYDSINKGYNTALVMPNNRGENNSNAALTEEDVKTIRTMYSNHIPYQEVYQLYKNIIGNSGFRKVWSFNTWTYVMPEVYTEENLKWHTEYQLNKKRLIPLTEFLIEEIRDLKIQGFSLKEIMKKTGCSLQTVRKYCADLTKNNSYKVKNIETGLIFNSGIEAAKWANCSKTSIYRGWNDGIKSAGTIPETKQPAHFIKI